MACSRVKLKSNWDTAAPCFRPHWVGNLSHKYLPIRTYCRFPLNTFLKRRFACWAGRCRVVKCMPVYCEIWCSHSGVAEDQSVVACKALSIAANTLHEDANLQRVYTCVQFFIFLFQTFVQSIFLSDTYQASCAQNARRKVCVPVCRAGVSNRFSQRAITVTVAGSRPPLVKCGIAVVFRLYRREEVSQTHVIFLLQNKCCVFDWLTFLFMKITIRGITV
jgi:hypothetical protein